MFTILMLYYRYIYSIRHIETLLLNIVIFLPNVIKFFIIQSYNDSLHTHNYQHMATILLILFKICLWYLSFNFLYS